MIRLKSRRNDRENRRRRPFPGLVHTPGTPLLHHLGGDHGWPGASINTLLLSDGGRRVGNREF